MSTDSKPLLTAIIPVGPLRDRVNILKENLKNWIDISESISIVLILDDHGDGTVEEISNFLRDNPAENIIKVVGNFGSPGKARNAGRQLVNTPWVAFWDADDQPVVGEILKVLQSGEIGNYQCLCFDYVIVDSHSLSSTSESDLKEEEKIENVMLNPGLWRWVFRNKLITGTDFSEERMGEDQLFLAEILEREPRISLQASCGYRYFVNSESQLTNRSDLWPDLLKVQQKMKRLVLRNGSNIEIKELILIMFVRMTMTLIMKANWSIKGKAFLNFAFLAIKSPRKTFNVIWYISLKIVSKVFYEEK